ncbi:tubulin/FtsZ family protein [Halohasta litorea]|uniref:Tubulin-like protein CetZ n=1 Tax=Halohasta litorea TaxID=869891 RepID=A0ABD6D9L8_9EURY|nr:tubulin/FtsZ family protein [Halohasta litorea]
MKLALFGVGNAGTRIVDQLLDAESRTDRPLTDGNVLAFNTTPSAFADTSHIDDERQVVIGDIHPDVSRPEDLADESGEDRREGVAGDPELGVEVARDDLPEIRRALDLVDDTEVDAAMIVAGLGGGTGCGLGAVLLEELASIYELPIYVLGVLPTSEESDRRAWTAARAVRTFVPLADAVFPIDTESWLASAESDDYDELNRAIATRLVSLFGAGERETAAISELRMDPNDLKRTLDVGGLATIGYAETELEEVSEGWYRRLRRLLGLDVPEREPQTDAVSIKNLVQRAADSKLTLQCDIETADRVLLVLSGPPKELSRKGFETGRYLLEDKTGTVEILAGDEPLPEGSRITATILLSNVTGVPRIETLQRRAVEFQREQDDLSASDPDDLSAATTLSTSDTQRSAGNQSTGDDQSAGDEQPPSDDHGFDFQEAELVDQSEADSEGESTSSEDETEEEPTPADGDTADDDTAATESESTGDGSAAENEPQKQ